jgi:hypothetical protein
MDYYYSSDLPRQVNRSQCQELFEDCSDFDAIEELERRSGTVSGVGGVIIMLWRHSPEHCWRPPLAPRFITRDETWRVVHGQARDRPQVNLGGWTRDHKRREH